MDIRNKPINLNWWLKNYTIKQLARSDHFALAVSMAQWKLNEIFKRVKVNPKDYTFADIGAGERAYLSFGLHSLKITSRAIDVFDFTKGTKLLFKKWGIKHTKNDENKIFNKNGLIQNSETAIIQMYCPFVKLSNVFIKYPNLKLFISDPHIFENETFQEETKDKIESYFLERGFKKKVISIKHNIASKCFFQNLHEEVFVVWFK